MVDEAADVDDAADAFPPREDEANDGSVTPCAIAKSSRMKVRRPSEKTAIKTEDANNKSSEGLLPHDASSTRMLICLSSQIIRPAY